jgi:hypothetical protein
MRKPPFCVLLGLFLLSLSLRAIAGVYLGAEADSDDKKLYYIGAQTGGTVFLNAFLGALEYHYEENNRTVKVKSKFITPTVGYRFQVSDPLKFSLAVGGTFEEKTEKRDTKNQKNESGAFVQFEGSYWLPDQNYELITSYSDSTELVWGRLRGRHRLQGRYFLGGEIFGMRNEDFNSYGAGPLFEVRGERLSTTIKAGLSNTSTYDAGVYGGIEFSVPF